MEEISALQSKQVWEDQARGSTMNMRQHCTLPCLIIHSTLFFPQVTDDGTDDKDSTTVSKIVTSETTSGTTVTTTTTHISKVSSTILRFVYLTLFYFICL